MLIFNGNKATSNIHVHLEKRKTKGDPNMTITISKGLNITEKTAQNLAKKSVTFVSPRVHGLKMVNAKYYNTSGNLLNPNIETFTINNRDGVISEFSSKRFQDGSKFEIYRLPDEIIKVFKNKFGEIKAFKSSIEQHNTQPESIYENVKNTMRSKTHNFFA